MQQCCQNNEICVVKALVNHDYIFKTLKHSAYHKIWAILCSFKLTQEVR